MDTTTKSDVEISGCACTTSKCCPCRPSPEGRRLGAWFILLVTVSWIMGAVIAKGFWWKLLAYVFPPYAWYLLTEKAMLILLGAEWLQ